MRMYLDKAELKREWMKERVATADDEIGKQIRRSWFHDLFVELEDDEAIEQATVLIPLQVILFTIEYEWTNVDIYDALRSLIPDALNKKSKTKVRRWIAKWERRMGARFDKAANALLRLAGIPAPVAPGLPLIRAPGGSQ